MILTQNIKSYVHLTFKNIFYIVKGLVCQADHTGLNQYCV